MITYTLQPTKTLFSIKAMYTSKVAFLGIPYDAGNTCRAGSRFAPWYIRQSSEFLEEFSMLYRRDIRECDISDWGNINVSFGDFGETLKRVKNVLGSINAQKYLLLGGEHTISIMVVNTFAERIKKYVQLDAHPDFYENYEGNKFSHACVARRIGETIGFDRITIIGIRSFSKQNIMDLEEFGVRYYTILDVYDDPSILKKEIRSADYLSIDMDFFDPAYVPEVSCPEPMGYNIRDFLMMIPGIGARIVDVTEVVPQSPFDISSITTAILLREIGIQLSIES